MDLTVEKISSDITEKVINNNLLDQSIFQAFQEGKIFYDYIHLGKSKIKIKDFVQLLQELTVIKPPRTGHLGNWEQILLGRSGMMDFNKVICENDLGYPLLYCFNQTETEDLSEGDFVYLPGSMLKDGNRKSLDLYSWDGHSFTKRERNRTYFAPFMLVYNDTFTPLINVHSENLKNHSKFQFKKETSLLLKYENLVKRILKVLLANAGKQKNDKRAYQEIFSHEVTLFGDMKRAVLVRDGEGYQFGERYYHNVDELIDAAILPLLAVDNPDNFFSNISTYRNSMPLISNVLSGILSAILGSHLQTDNPKELANSNVVNIHFHWGARSMAGYPPIKNGYFQSKSTKKSYRNMIQAIVGEINEIRPIYIVLIPSVIYSLLPNNKKDAELLETLFSDVYSLKDTINQEGLYLDKFKNVVYKFLLINQDNFSDYFLEKFKKQSGILHEFNGSGDKTYVPSNFEHLSFKEACIIVGYFHVILEELRSGEDRDQSIN